MSVRIVQAKKTSLRVPLSSSDMTVKVRALVDIDGNEIVTADIGEFNSVVVKQGSRSEVIKISAITQLGGTLGANLTVATNGRSMAPTYPYAGAATGLDFTTGDVILTNDAFIMSRFAMLDNANTWDEIQTFTLSPVVPDPTLPTDAVNRQWAEALANAGAADMSEIQKGLAEAATQAETDEGDDTGTTTAPTVVRPSKLLATKRKVFYAGATYGATLSQFDPLYVDAAASNKLKKALATAEATANVVAIAEDAGVDTNTGKRVYLPGSLVEGLTGLTAGAPVYLTDAGGFSPSPGTYRKVVGWAWSATSMTFMPRPKVEELAGLSTAVTTSVLESMAAFFGAPKAQGLRTAFTAGENLASGDVVLVSAADTVKRNSPSALPSAFDQGATLSGTYAIGFSALGRTGAVLDVSDGVKVIAHLANVSSGTDVPMFVRIPVTPSTGAVGTISEGTPISPFTNVENVTLALAGSGKVLTTYSKNNSIQANVSDVSSSISNGTAVVVDSSNCSEGFGDYVSDSHVLFIYRDTSNASIVFAKYTLSGNNLSASTTGTIATLTGKSFVIKGVRKMPGTNTFLIIIQNVTDGTAQAALATYNTGTSTFTIGAWTNFTSVSATSGIDCSIAPLSDTQAICVVGTSATAGVAFLVTVSGTTVTVGTLNAISARGAASQVMLAAVNARCALLTTMSGTTATVQLWEVNAAGTDISVRASTSRTTTYNGDTLEADFAAASFRVNPLRMGFYGIDDGNNDVDVGTGLYTFPGAVVGVTAAAASSAASVEVVTGGYVGTVSGRTAGQKQYADIGGLLTTDNNNSPTKVGTAKDATELIVQVSGT